MSARLGPCLVQAGFPQGSLARTWLSALLFDPGNTTARCRRTHPRHTCVADINHPGDNKERSAALAKKCLNGSGIAGALADTVSRLILATKNHDAGSDADAALMIDVDLSILGRDEKRFFEYEEQIRCEYRWVPSAVFRSKRANILQGFLDRKRIFTTDWFHNKYEEQARRNLASSIRKLKPRSR